ncbi:NADPH-dependent F420 reductase [Deinococcus yavapaiensis]|uniref:Pyrroline-5-carboxylate reductase catalytic N-terminal domain-containing protein n=1 Tax=Deinococcus yavapaiensis KR-236 TaxID=694435 RepID=A0A318S7I7_9DEIO|nr:NADPH-dependent F420 reductase [Deinococcus yavapaiensis]PYE53748.1 hypothetical protein DES52_1076 [Deinococcus yavapaiensis KR-236]
MNTKIGILGTGMMGATLGNRLARAGFQVMFGSRTPEKAAALAQTVGADARGGSLADAAAFGDIVVLAVGFQHAPDTIAAAGDLSGKVLLDITSAWDTSQRPVQLQVGHTTSAAEELARLVPTAHVVKSLNFLYAEVLEQPVFDGVPADAYYCGDDDESKARVAEMLRALTLEPLDAGPLSSARLLEPLGLLWMRLARFSGAGPHSAFKLLRREVTDKTSK